VSKRFFEVFLGCMTKTRCIAAPVNVMIACLSLRTSLHIPWLQRSTTLEFVGTFTWNLLIIGISGHSPQRQTLGKIDDKIETPETLTSIQGFSSLSAHLQVVAPTNLPPAKPR
jgi:hypothetical protein